jgi:nicotinamidase-related amidase
MAWAQPLATDKLGIIHIQDWHDPSDALQRTHLQQFGHHCVAGTRGAEFVFDRDAARGTVIDSTTLNDFEGAHLKETLQPFAFKATKVGLIGVWTEAKILFLAYELATRYPNF